MSTAQPGQIIIDNPQKWHKPKEIEAEEATAAATQVMKKQEAIAKKKATMTKVAELKSKPHHNANTSLEHMELPDLQDGLLLFNNSDTNAAYIVCWIYFPGHKNHAFFQGEYFSPL